MNTASSFAIQPQFTGAAPKLRVGTLPVATFTMVALQLPAFATINLVARHDGPLASAADLSTAEHDLAASGTSEACRAAATRLLRAFRDAARGLLASVTVADDGGIIAELESTSRELLFTISEAGDARFFTALDESGTRRSGIASLEAAWHLARWVAGASQQFPTSGIVLG